MSEGDVKPAVPVVAEAHQVDTFRESSRVESWSVPCARADV